MEAWLMVERYENWLSDKKRGFDILGFAYRQRRISSLMVKGSKIIIYIASGKSVIAGIHEVISEHPVHETALLWDEIYPIRIRIRPELILEEGKFIPISNLLKKLSFTKDLKDWRQAFRSSLRRLNDQDYLAIRQAIEVSNAD